MRYRSVGQVRAVVEVGQEGLLAVIASRDDVMEEPRGEHAWSAGHAVSAGGVPGRRAGSCLEVKV
jgi:hypothetical protein